MDHSFDTVDEKVAETEFFLQHMASAGTDMFAFKCYLSAYLSASRTITLALQQFRDLPGFDTWYEPHRGRLKVDPMAKFFLDARNSHVHGGPYPLSGGRFHAGEAHYFFTQERGRTGVPVSDMVTACRQHFVGLLEIMYDCYVQLGVHIDLHQYFTREHFATDGRTIDDAEVEVRGWVMESLIEEGYDEDARWHDLRSRVQGCGINDLFFSYLGRPTPQPTEPEEYADFAYTPQEKGWICIPAGYQSIQDYWREAGFDLEKLELL